MAQDIVMACLTSARQDAAILRMAQRHARARDIPWCVVYLELWDDQKEAHIPSRNRVLEQVALAERMGASTLVTKAADYARGFQEALAECKRRDQNPVMIIAGGVTPTSSALARRGVTAIEEQCRDQRELMLVAPNEEKGSAIDWLKRLHMRRLTAGDVCIALGAVAMAYLTNHVLASVLPPAAPSQIHNTHTFMIFLIAGAMVAGRCGLLPGLIATVGSFLTIKFFTMTPLYTLRVDYIEDYISLGLFLIASAVVCLVNSQVHAEAEASEVNEWRMQALLQVYKISLHARTRSEALSELHNNLHEFLSADTAVFLPSVVSVNTLQVVWPESPGVNDEDMEILNATWANLQAGNYASTKNPNTGWRFEPLISATGELGVLAIRVPPTESTDTHFDQYIKTIAELVASILEKIESVDMKEESRVRDEREKLRTSLLSSVSHDLKTPLASIIGALSVHRSMYEKLPEGQRRELTDAALVEAQRLDSFITNILDLAKIESGAVKFKREWQSPEDLVQRVKKRMRLRFEHHSLKIGSPASAVEVEIDPVISEQALLNVLDNAVKYTPKGSVIEVKMETGDEMFSLHVHDQGPGIPESDMERIFDKYTRLQRLDSQVAGTGLGLAVARAAMRGQGGDITVKNHPEGGAVFTLSWPQWRVATTTSSAHRLKSA